MTRVLVGDLRTGRRFFDLPFAGLSWELRANRPETVRAVALLNDPNVRALKLANAGTPGKAYLAVVENDVVIAAGLIWAYAYDRDSGKVDLAASGLGSYFDHRTILPAATTVPAGADTVLTGFDLGTIAKKLVQQANGWAGAGLPIVYESDRVGPHDRTYLGAEMKTVGSALQQLREVENGPDIAFIPRWNAARTGIEWLLRTGTEAQPRIQSASIHRWDYSVPGSAITGLTVTGDGSALTSQAWTTGGRSADVSLAAVATDATLTSLGFPLYESIDSSHSTVTEQATLAGYSSEAVRVGKQVPVFWSFRVRADESPRVGEYAVGDVAKIILKDDPFIADGAYRTVIAGMTGDQDGLWVKITGGQVTEWIDG